MFMHEYKELLPLAYADTLNQCQQILKGPDIGEIIEKRAIDSNQRHFFSHFDDAHFNYLNIYLPTAATFILLRQFRHYIVNHDNQDERDTTFTEMQQVLNILGRIQFSWRGGYERMLPEFFDSMKKVQNRVKDCPQLTSMSTFTRLTSDFPQLLMFMTDQREERTINDALGNYPTAEELYFRRIGKIGEIDLEKLMQYSSVLLVSMPASGIIISTLMKEWLSFLGVRIHLEMALLDLKIPTMDEKPMTGDRVFMASNSMHNPDLIFVVDDNPGSERNPGRSVTAVTKELERRYPSIPVVSAIQNRHLVIENKSGKI